MMKLQLEMSSYLSNFAPEILSRTLNQHKWIRHLYSHNQIALQGLPVLSPRWGIHLEKDINSVCLSVSLCVFVSLSVSFSLTSKDNFEQLHLGGELKTSFWKAEDYLLFNQKQA